MSARAATLLVPLIALTACREAARAPERGDQAEAPAASTRDSVPGDTRPDTLGERASAAPAPTATTTDGDTVAVGVVRVLGANPFPVFVLAAPPPGGPAVALQGALRDELGALVGLEVRVTGRAIAHQPPLPDRAVLVSSYEIVSVAGRKPEVGILRAEGNVVSIGGTRLVDAPDELRNAVGAKVWVLGTTRDGALAVESYGIIRRP